MEKVNRLKKVGRVAFVVADRLGQAGKYLCFAGSILLLSGLASATISNICHNAMIKQQLKNRK